MASASTYKGEIQGLRAIAVGLVVIFHVWPTALPGGFVGVDVFFVISGYLITGLLVRAALRDGRISLIDFYARRARRLLPAASVVLVATFLGTLWFLPEARWRETATEITASALYVQNWVLAWLSGDYLGAENAASPVQHYWSLSIEEQFYVVWPFVMIAAIAASKRLGISMLRVLLGALTVIFFASLAASVFLTARDQAQAYFVTHTRMWELALGGILAMTMHRFGGGQALRGILLVLGLAAIFWSASAYSDATAFPGYAALLPTLGTAMVILAGDVRLAGFRGLASSWLSWLGDRSYSIYLWHWPLVVFYVADGQRIGLIDGTVLIALTLAISHVSYRWIEEPFRHAKARAELRPLIFGAASIAVCALAPAMLSNAVSGQAQAALRVGDADHPGPLALLAGARVPAGLDPVPSLVALKDDLPTVYLGDPCHQNQRDSDPKHCILGDPDGTVTVAVTGDSHAAQWVPALERIAVANNWRLVTLTKSACAFARIDMSTRSKPYPSCEEWRENTITWLKENDVEIMFTGLSRGHLRKDVQPIVDGLRSVWAELNEAGIRIVAFHDTPWLPFQPGDCLAGDAERCFAPRQEVEAPRFMEFAAEGMEGVTVVDMTDGICGADRCDAVVGNVVVWRDHHHLTATYAALLAPSLAEKLGVKGDLASMTATSGARIRATLRCGPVGDSRPFERSVLIERSGRELSMRSGDWQDRRKRYDLWSGVVEGERVTLDGSYIQGGGGVKEVSFAGTLAGGELRLEGRRGPRDCTVRTSSETAGEG